MPQLRTAVIALAAALSALICACATPVKADDVRSDAPEKVAFAPQSVVSDEPHTPRLRLDIHEDMPTLRPIDLIAQPDDLWERIRNGFAMPDLINEAVLDRQAYYLNRPEYITRMVERSRRYLYYIVEQLEKRGMPTELALLPMVESAFNPMALSSARASGLWQFVPSTGKTYNLSQNWWLDERRDIVASTNAALDYLQTIYEMHGDWHLALASYNWGENAVARAIERNRQADLPTDYAHLSMPAETRYYVPKLQALKNIIAQPQLFGVALPQIPNRPYFALVKKPAGIDLALAAKLAETPMTEFVALNPSYNRPVMPGSAGDSIIIPADRVERYTTNLESHDQPLSSWATHNLQKGETIDSLAARHGIGAARLRQVNGIPAGWRVPLGHALLVPGAGAAALELSDADLPASNALATQAPKLRYIKVHGKLRAVAVKAPVKAHPVAAKPGKRHVAHRVPARVAARP